MQNSTNELPKSKQPYQKPQLFAYGSIKSITRGLNNKPIASGQKGKGDNIPTPIPGMGVHQHPLTA